MNDSNQMSEEEIEKLLDVIEAPNPPAGDLNVTEEEIIGFLSGSLDADVEESVQARIRADEILGEGVMEAKKICNELFQPGAMTALRGNIRDSVLTAFPGADDESKAADNAARFNVVIHVKEQPPKAVASDAEPWALYRMAVLVAALHQSSIRSRSIGDEFDTVVDQLAADLQNGRSKTFLPGELFDGSPWLRVDNQDADYIDIRAGRTEDDPLDQFTVQFLSGEETVVHQVLSASGKVRLAPEDFEKAQSEDADRIGFKF